MFLFTQWMVTQISERFTTDYVFCTSVGCPMRVIFLFASFCLAQPTMAYIPTADFILAEMAKRCISAQTEFNGVLKQANEISLASLALTAGGLIIKSKTSATDSDAQPKESGERVNLYVVQNLVGCHHDQAKRIKDYLTALNVDLSKINHGLANFEPAFIIGADPTDSKAPQIWIDKQNFLPVKEIAAQYETVFEHWAPVTGLADKRWLSTLRSVRNNEEIKLDMAEAEPLSAQRK